MYQTTNETDRFQKRTYRSYSSSTSYLVRRSARRIEREKGTDARTQERDCRAYLVIAPEIAGGGGVKRRSARDWGRRWWWWRRRRSRYRQTKADMLNR
ncbi:hypothetical protein NL676_031828 [Syzygium grande]|nr:hypothetical protein NL676_031828 [Syzygium grande]